VIGLPALVSIARTKRRILIELSIHQAKKVSGQKSSMKLVETSPQQSRYRGATSMTATSV
jgi:hypothetical protein